MERTLSSGRPDPAYGLKKPTPAELQARIILWANRLPMGSEWKHWSGTIFEVVGLGISNDTSKVEVQYREAILGERPLPLYQIGSLSPVNPEIVKHRPAEEWEEEVTVHKGQMLPVEVVKQMPPHEKLAVANERQVVARHRRVQRMEQFVEMKR